MACVIQAQEYMTALHSACQCLESTATSKTAENKLQKALARVHKCAHASQSAISDTSKTVPKAAPAKAVPAAQTAELADADTNPPARYAPPAATDAAQTPMQPVQTADVAMNDVALSAPSQSETDKHVHQSAAMFTAKQTSAQPGEETVLEADKENAGANKEKARADKEAAKAAREQEKALKEAMWEQQNAEREQQQLQKEQQKAEKERQRLEKDQQKAEKEQQKAEKEAEKERVRSAILLHVGWLMCLQLVGIVAALSLLSISPAQLQGLQYQSLSPCESAL